MNDSDKEVFEIMQNAVENFDASIMRNCCFMFPSNGPYNYVKKFMRDNAARLEYNREKIAE